MLLVSHFAQAIRLVTNVHQSMLQRVTDAIPATADEIFFHSQSCAQIQNEVSGGIKGKPPSRNSRSCYLLQLYRVDGLQENFSNVLLETL